MRDERSQFKVQSSRFKLPYVGFPLLPFYRFTVFPFYRFTIYNSYSPPVPIN